MHLSQANGNGAHEKIVIKKYANRRLYDTSASAYVTLEHLSELTRQGKEFIVQDAKTGEDLTRAVLAQIIFEQENKKEGVLPVSFLRQLMNAGGDTTYRGTSVKMELSEKVRLEIGVSDHFVQPTVDALLGAARTGEVGDGKIFVLPVEKVYRIRTGEEDQAAVTPVEAVALR